MEPAKLLEQRGVPSTANREQVVAALALAGCPLTPQELLDQLGGRMNRVTLYRILDLLVEHGVVERHNAGERAFRYCLRSGPSGHLHAGHAHFTCVRCGHTQCLDSRSLEASLGEYLAHVPMRVETAELRFGGVCETCLGA
jgi:Fur family transcriptional regulator, ferric uptake regulator